jgi:hypothetical protein
MDHDISMQLDTTVLPAKQLPIDHETMKEIPSGFDVLKRYFSTEEDPAEEEEFPPKISVQTVETPGSLKAVSNFSQARPGRPSSGTTQRSNGESSGSKQQKEHVSLIFLKQKMPEWKRELYRDVVNWGYRKCEWTLGVFNNENLFRILCIHFDRSFSKVVLDILFTIAYLTIAMCLDLETLNSRPGTFIRFTKLQFVVFQYIHAAWLTATSITGRICLTLAVIAKGLIEGPFPVILDIRWVLDVFLLICIFANPGFLPLLGVLRLVKVLTYAERFPSLIALNEIYNIVKESYIVILSIIGIMVMCGIFVAMFLNNLIVGYLS